MKKLLFFISSFFLVFFAIFANAHDCEEPLYNADRSKWVTIFESKTCCSVLSSNSWFEIKIIQAPPVKDCPISPYELIFLEHDGEKEKVLYREFLGVGAWCYVLFYDKAAVGNFLKDDNQASILLLWVDGQATRAYAFVINQSNIQKVFEATEGRASYSFRFIGENCFPDIVQHDSALHLKDSDFPKRLLRKLKGHKDGVAIFRYNGQTYELFDIRPDN